MRTASQLRIGVTAAGVVSALGAGREEFASNLFAGRCAAAPSQRFPDVIAAEIADFNPQPWLGNKGIRVLDRSARLLAVAAHMALTEGGLSPERQDGVSLDLGLVCGTLFGSVHSIASFDWSGLTEGPSLVSPMEFPNTVINAPAGQTAIRYRMGGVNSTVCAGLASGLHAIQYATEFLRFGRARILLAGGVDELCEESVNGFRRMQVTSPAGVAQPFGDARDGVVPGEGAVLWMLESEGSARAAERAPWLEVCGFGCAHDAHAIPCFDVRGCAAAEAMRLAIADAGIAPEDIACIVASAGGSRIGDEMEARALDSVFDEHLAQTAVCAPKAAFGEAMGASGALCATVAALALERQLAPPTPNVTASDVRLPLSAQAVPIAGKYALINAFSCDGNNASLVVGLWNR
jgi:3-oxoacyl-[acyl-carrier-protein] synthase II